MPERTEESCLDENEVVELLEDRIDGSRRAEVHRHLDGCSQCRVLVADTARAMGSVSPEPTAGEAAAPLPAGKVLGRYVILETVGAGAMGVIYAAYDPELGRKIALKLL